MPAGEESPSQAPSNTPSPGVISDPIAIQVFERCPLGIIQADTKYEIVYANKALLNMLALQGYLGLSVHALFPAEHRAIFEEQFRRRLHGESDDYELELVRSDGNRIPVRITAMPVTDTGGRVTGAIAIVRNMRVEKSVAALDVRIDIGQTAPEIFRAIGEELDSILPYELCVVSVLEDEMRGARVVFTRSHSGEVHWPARWFQISPAALEWVKRREIQAIDDYQAFVSDERWRATRDPDVVNLLADMKSMVRVPIVRKDVVVASLSLYRTKLNGFTPEDISMLAALPLDKAILVALSYREAEELRFRNELGAQLAKHEGDDLFGKAIAELIVHRLSEHYGWEAVGIFKVNQESQRFELQAQAAQPGIVLADIVTQPIFEGILAHSYRNDTDVVIGDLLHDSQFAQIFRGNWTTATTSELCMRICAEGEIIGFLNIEDSRRNAFSKGEQDTLRRLLDEIGSMLERRKNRNIASAAFKWTPSALFIVKPDGRISKVNPTTTDLLQYSEQELRGKPLQDVLEPTELLPTILHGSGDFRDDFRIVRSDGRRLKVLLASSQIDHGMGTILSAEEITSRLRIEELDFLQRLFYEVAAQTKMPLSLTFEWLTRLRDKFATGAQPRSAAVLDELDKAIRQLRKADITYDRLVLYDKERIGGLPRNPVIIRIGRLLDELRNELPASDSKRLAISGDALTCELEADSYQLSFSLLATVSYGLRFLPEDRELQVNAASENRQGTDWVCLTVHAIAPPWPRLMRRKVDLLMNQVISDIALGSGIIEAFVKENGGEYEGPSKLEGDVSFRFLFPLAKMAA